MSKPYIPAEFPKNCEYVFLSRIEPFSGIIRGQNTDESWTMKTTVRFEVCDENKIAFDEVFRTVEKQFDHEPTVAEQTEFFANEVEAKILEVKAELSGWTPQ
jgi:hypothetical protein